MSSNTTYSTFTAHILGVGAWGPGFNNWKELQSLFAMASDNTSTDNTSTENTSTDSMKVTVPKPEIIPANERRRSPLPVKIAVETSWQALQSSGKKSEQLACVFGSGFGDTEITDYMCRTLNTELKQLSPTKFHNSVHNAAAGYWTISTDCMRSANSVAAYHETVGLSFLEGLSQGIFHNERVLITLFDTKAHSVYEDIFHCQLPFSAAFVISTDESDEASAIATLEIQRKNTAMEHSPFANTQLEELYQRNPSAKALSILDILQHPEKTTQLALCKASHLSVKVKDKS